MLALARHRVGRSRLTTRSDAPTSSATEAVQALLTVESLRVRADALQAGDRIVAYRHGVITVDTLRAARTTWRPGRGAFIVLGTEGGIYWTCPPDDRSCLRVTA
jgi:hypothetical protein